MNAHPTTHRRTAAVAETLEPRRLLANVLLKDIGAGVLHGNPSELTVVGGSVYFVASTKLEVAGTFWELWRTDGTPSGTRKVSNFHDGPGGDERPWADTNAPGLAYFSGPRALIAVGDDLWYYRVRHSSSQVLLVSLNRLGADGQTTSWDLGSINLSLKQSLSDVQNVDGKVWFYRDADEFALDPALRRSRWWTIDENDELVATSKRRAGDVAGKGPAYAGTALMRDKRLAVRDTATRGRELWAADNPQVENGVLRVFGSDLDDDIVVTRRADKPSYVDVRINGFRTTFRGSSFRRIQLDLLRGDDRGVVDESNGAIAVPCAIFGGQGNDTLQGAAARDTIYGGEGDDLLYGMGDRDHLFGEHGKDRLLGGAAADILWGGVASDLFVKSAPTERRDFNSEDRLA
jgi:ELWxxDGT repeat protein